MLPDDTLEALLRLARGGYRAVGYRPRQRTWHAIDATLKDGLTRGYVVLPEMPPQARGIVAEAWRQWCVLHDHPVAILWPHGRRSTLHVSMPPQRVLAGAALGELAALAEGVHVTKDFSAIVVLHYIAVTVWTAEAEAFAAVVCDYLLEHMEPVP